MLLICMDKITKGNPIQSIGIIKGTNYLYICLLIIKRGGYQHRHEIFTNNPLNFVIRYDNCSNGIGGGK